MNLLCNWSHKLHTIFEITKEHIIKRKKSLNAHKNKLVINKSYEDIMNEKYELLYKIDSLKKRGISIPGNVTIESNIDEIKYGISI